MAAGSTFSPSSSSPTEDLANQLPSLKPWDITKTCCLLRHFSLSIGSKYGKPNNKLSRISPGMHDKPTRIGGYYWAYHFLNHSATLHKVVTSICLCLDLSRTGRRPLWHLNQHFSGVHWHSFAIAVNNGWCNTTTSTGHCGAHAYYYVILIVKVTGFCVFHW